MIIYFTFFKTLIQNSKFKIQHFFVGIFLVGFIYSNSVVAAVYPMPTSGEDVVGSIFTAQVQPKDSVTSIRMRYELSLDSFMAANRHIKPNKLRVSDVVIIPAQFVLPLYRKGIVLNMPELRLYYFSPDGKFVYTFPVAMGRPDWRTPTVATKVIKKEEDPIWMVPKSIQAYMLEAHNIDLPDIVMPGPKNPLGKYALYLGKRGYLIHGTNEPPSVGTFASSGCMRLSSEAIEMLYQEVPVETQVHIIHHPIKSGWLDNKLYLEVHNPIELDEKESTLNSITVEAAISKALAVKSAIINWDLVHDIVKEHDGIPHIVGTAV